MEHLQSAHIPVIAIDIPMPGATFVGVDNYRAGLMAGRLVGTYASQLWKGRIDKVLSLGLPSSGPVPAARMQGQIDGLRESLIVPDEHILHLNSKNTYEESHKVISAILPTITSAQHIVILGMNDEVTLGALAAFVDAGASERVIAIRQGADQPRLINPGRDPIGSLPFYAHLYMFGASIFETFPYAHGRIHTKQISQENEQSWQNLYRSAKIYNKI